MDEWIPFCPTKLRFYRFFRLAPISFVVEITPSYFGGKTRNTDDFGVAK